MHRAGQDPLASVSTSISAKSAPLVTGHIGDARLQQGLVTDVLTAELFALAKPEFFRLCAKERSAMVALSTARVIWAHVCISSSGYIEDFRHVIASHWSSWAMV
jgi:hypothetical protein